MAVIAREPALGDDWLTCVGRLLLLALPFLFLIGRAPADIAVALIGLLFLTRSVADRSWGWLRTPWIALGLGLWLYLIATSAVAAAPGDAWSRALPFGRFILFAAALQHWLLVDREMQHWLLAAVGLVIGFVVLDSLVQYAFGSDLFGQSYSAKRLTGPFANPVPGTFLAKTSLPVLGLGIVLAARWHRRRRLLLAVAVIALLGLTIALAGERSALVTFGLGVVVFGFLLRDLRRPLLTAGALAALAIAAAIVISPSLNQRLLGATVHDLDDFWERRYGELVVRSIAIWSDDPVIGVGLKNFRKICVNDHFQPYGPPSDRCYTHPHSFYLEWLTESGLVGLVGFLALMGIWARDLIRHMRLRPGDPILAGAGAALLVFFWPLQVSMSFFSNWNAILLWLTVGLALARCAPGGAPASRSMIPDG